MKVNKMNQPNPGVKCVVNSCYYYMSGDKCSAEKIEVQPKNASSTEETDCATFISQTNVT
jgi:hypothetical protein